MLLHVGWECGARTGQRDGAVGPWRCSRPWPVNSIRSGGGSGHVEPARVRAAVSGASMVPGPGHAEGSDGGHDQDHDEHGDDHPPGRARWMVPALSFHRFDGSTLGLAGPIRILPGAHAGSNSGASTSVSGRALGAGTLARAGQIPNSRTAM